MKTILYCAFALPGFWTSTGNGHAAVVFTFKEVGGNVIATSSGFLMTPGASKTFDVNSNCSFLSGTEHSLYGIEGLYSYAGVGLTNASGLTANPDLFTGDSFGFIVVRIYFPASVNSSSIYYPNITFTWIDKSLSEIGLGNLTSSPMIVWAANYGFGNTISFAAIPEPNTTLLAFTPCLFLLTRKRV